MAGSSSELKLDPDCLLLPVNNIPALDAALVLRRYGLRPNPRLGQNFLQDAEALAAITAEAHIRRTDSVLEIGCGLGSLTRYLAAVAGRVIAVELDQRLASIAAEVLKPYQNVVIVRGDILDISPADLGLPAGYLVVANIPYNITSPIFRHLLEARPRPQRMVLTVQEEVAERVCSQPPKMSILALGVQVYGSATIVTRIPAGAFFPSPKVDSGVVCVEIYDEPRIASSLLPIFFTLIKAGFGQKRKTLRNNFSAGLRISPARANELLIGAGIDPRLRAEALGFAEWESLCRTPGLKEVAGPARGH